MHQHPFIDGEFWVFPDGRRVLRQVGAEDPPADDPPKEEDPPENDPPEEDDEPFDLERAKAKIAKSNSEAANLRQRLKELEPLAQKAKDLEESQKTDLQKATDAKDAAAKEASAAKQEAARLRVALKKGLTESQAKRLVGETEEDLEKDADELLESFKPDDDGPEPRRRPRERLRPGAAPGAEPEKNDPASLAAEVPRGW